MKLPNSDVSKFKSLFEAQMGSRERMDLWIHERHLDSAELSFRVEKTLFSVKSPYQQIDVVKTVNHGVVLIHDGIVMLTERDEFIYHEMIAHVALFVHPKPQNILVIGGGDGGTVREVLKHETIKKVVLVEIDEAVVDVCRRFLPSVSQALDDPRLEIIFDDGINYVAETRKRFDIAIIDSTDPVGPGIGLFEKPFYENIIKILADQGILVTQAESPFYDINFQEIMFSNQRPFFKKLHMYLYSTLAYVGGLYSFGFASKGLCPLNDFDPGRIDGSNITMRYYNSNIHRAAFMLPGFIAEKLRGILDSMSW